MQQPAIAAAEEGSLALLTEKSIALNLHVEEQQVDDCRRQEANEPVTKQLPFSRHVIFVLVCQRQRQFTIQATLKTGQDWTRVEAEATHRDSVA